MSGGGKSHIQSSRNAFLVHLIYDTGTTPESEDTIKSQKPN
jgi:hypothetical protein